MKTRLITTLSLVAAFILISLAPLPAMAEMPCRMGGDHGMSTPADRNGDGKITKKEFLAAAKERAERRFSWMDANHDGVLDIEDHLVHFDAMDSNHDGLVSRDEFIEHHKNMRKHHQGMKHKGMK